MSRRKMVAPERIPTARKFHPVQQVHSITEVAADRHDFDVGGNQDLVPKIRTTKCENANGGETNLESTKTTKTPAKTGENVVGDTELESVTSCMSSKRENLKMPIKATISFLKSGRVKEIVKV